MSDDPATLVSCQELVKGYETGGQDTGEVLRSLDLALPQGESVAITGISGSGKSTLLHLIAGLEKPDSGAVFYRGQRVDGLSEKALCEWRNLEIGFVYQFHHLLPEFSVLENVAMPLFIRNENTRGARMRARAILKHVGMGDRFAERRPGELSGGERQRVAICRALIGKPSLLLADEPTGNLDSRSSAEVEELMLSMQAEQGVSLLLATHSATLAGKFSRRYELVEGKLLTY